MLRIQNMLTLLGCFFVLVAHTTNLPAENQSHLSGAKQDQASEPIQNSAPSSLTPHDSVRAPAPTPYSGDSDPAGKERIYRVQSVEEQWHFWLPFGVNSVLALVGVITAIAVWDQSKTMVMSQRAWLTITPDRYEHEKNTNFFSAGPELTRMSFAIKNVGTTPAHVVEVALKYVLLDTLDDLPEQPSYGSPQDRSGLLLVAHDSANELLSLEDPDEFSPMILSELLLGRKKLAFAYGYVCYKDTFQKKRFTRVGYVFEYFRVPTQGRYRIARRAGPSAYNRAT